MVGAGFAGLAAAAALRKAGRRVLVFEARPRVGGRVAAPANVLGERVDTGGQFFCEDMPEVTALARAFGKTFVEPRSEGRMLLRPPPPAGESPDGLFEASFAVRERMNALDPDDPALAGLSVAEWARRQDDPKEAVDGFLSTVEGLWCADPGRVPLPFLIRNDRRITNEVSELQYFLRETMASLAEDLCRTLSDAVRLEHEVEHVRVEGEGVAVDAAGETFSARTLILAVPPTAARRIGLSPAPPERIALALAAWESAAVVKLVLRYATASWRARGLSGTVAWRDPPGLFVLEASPSEQQPALVMFVAGRAALRWRAEGEEALRRRALDRLAEALGEEAMTPLAVSLHDWTTERPSGGAYADLILDRDAPDAEDVLREGWGPVLFASSELSPSFPGYVEGAIVAGREAARRALARLAAASQVQK